MRLDAGDYTIDVTAQGYKPAWMKVTITENEVNVANVVMEKV